MRIRALIIAALALTAATQAHATGGTVPNVERIRTNIGRDVFVFTDPLTGCQSYSGEYGLAGPRLWPNGEQVCGPVRRPPPPKVDPRGRAPDLTGKRK